MSALIPATSPVDPDTGIQIGIPIEGTYTDPATGKTLTIDNPGPGGTVKSGYLVVTTPDSTIDDPIQVTGAVTIAASVENATIRGDGSAGTIVTVADNQGPIAGFNYHIDAEAGVNATDEVNLSGASVDPDVKVDGELVVGTDGETIAEVGPTGAAATNTYVHTAAGNDQIMGTDESDFIRGGSGNDTINGGGGDDLIRMGSGSDTVSTADGADIIYVTGDQLDGGFNVITDFDSGVDQIQMDKDLEGDVDVTFNDASTKIQIEFTSDGETTTTSIESTEGDAFADDDVTFV